MLPGFTADDSLYQSRVCYVSGRSGAAAAAISPAATRRNVVCRRTPDGGMICVGNFGPAFDILLGAGIGGVIGGGLGAVIGAAIVSLYCLIFGCD